MTDNHPTTPPPELVEQWRNQAPWDPAPASLEHAASIRQCWIATQAARWGADQQLEQCVAWLEGYERDGWAAEQMRSGCRPQPPSLKEQALEILNARFDTLPPIEADTVRRALEQLND